MTEQSHTFYAVRMAREHLSAVAELERLCFSEPWSENALELLLTEAATGYVVLLEERVIAYGGMMTVPGEGQITNIAVHPEHRRKGCGRAVVDALLSEARAHGAEQVSLEVRESNRAAAALYERAGFFVAGRRKRFYRNPTEDAFVMLMRMTD